VTYTLQGGTVLGTDGPRTADVVIDAGHVVAVHDAAADVRAAADGQMVDTSGLVIAPGLLDLQVNGAHGIDLASEPERLWEVAAALPRYGVAGFLPTIITSPPEVVEAALATLAAGPPPDWCGATPLGLHVEGPMLNPARKGAHPAAGLRLPDPALVAGWTRQRGVALVTLAPELAGAGHVITRLRSAGVVVSAGHTDATAEELNEAVADGVAYVTHLFNAMSPLGHRAPGVVGALLADPRLVAGLIADGIHVHPTAVAAAWRALGPQRMNLVTDAIGALGMGHGTARLGDVEVTINADGVRLPDGTLAGSNVSLDQALRNLVAYTGCTAADALATVTSTPARLLGLVERAAVAPGAPAHLTVLTADLQVVATIVGGELVHRAEAAWRW
jgi:N-acetylglucosamine-6-phosphate deacetylase